MSLLRDALPRGHGEEDEHEHEQEHEDEDEEEDEHEQEHGRMIAFALAAVHHSPAK
jgi:hypothetical protein